MATRYMEKLERCHFLRDFLTKYNRLGMGTSPRIGLKKYSEIIIFLLRMKEYKSLEYGDSNLSLFDKKKLADMQLLLKTKCSIQLFFQPCLNPLQEAEIDFPSEFQISH
jgi:hypothetical protein